MEQILESDEEIELNEISTIQQSYYESSEIIDNLLNFTNYIFNEKHINGNKKLINYEKFNDIINILKHNNFDIISIINEIEINQFNDVLSLWDWIINIKEIKCIFDDYNYFSNLNNFCDVYYTIIEKIEKKHKDLKIINDVLKNKTKFKMFIKELNNFGIQLNKRNLSPKTFILIFLYVINKNAHDKYNNNDKNIINIYEIFIDINKLTLAVDNNEIELFLEYLEKNKNVFLSFNIEILKKIIILNMNKKNILSKKIFNIIFNFIQKI